MAHDLEQNRSAARATTHGTNGAVSLWDLLTLISAGSAAGGAIAAARTISDSHVALVIGIVAGVALGIASVIGMWRMSSFVDRLRQARPAANKWLGLVYLGKAALVFVAIPFLGFCLTRLVLAVVMSPH